MMPSLYSAVSGLKNNQEMMDVIGNNIANVNTPGFKSSQVNFADLLSQTIRGASMPTSTTGGTNPIQIGQGVSVASLDSNFTGGSMQQTGINTNLGINGDGLFILGSSGNQYYTRDGDFSFDSKGNLVSNANGMNVQGWMASSSGVVTPSPTTMNININSAQVPANATANMALSGNFNSQLNNGTLLFANGTGSFPFSVANGDAPPATGNWQLSFTQGSQFNTWNWTITDANTGASLDGGTVTLDTAGNVTNITQSSAYTGTVGTRTGNTFLAANTAIVANTNDTIKLAVNGGPATTITIPAGAAYTPAQLVAAVNAGISSSALNGQVTAALDGTGRLTFAATSGSNAVLVSAGATDASVPLGFTVLGDAGIGTFTIQKSAVGGSPSAFSLAAGTTTPATIPATTFTPPSTPIVQPVYDSQGNQYTVDMTFTKNSLDNWSWSTSSITDSTGKIYTPTSGGSGTMVFDGNGNLTSGGTGTLAFAPNGVTPVSINIDLSKLTQNSSPTTASVSTQDGYAPGTLTSYAIDQTGTITGSFSNGVKKTLAQIALANFPNPNGLQSDGNNMYSRTANSDPGTFTTNAAGTGSLGTIQTGSLEMSNVDLSREMSNMIIAQSGFDANSKVITVDDQLMQTLVNMIPA
jgi:flagellar hook protein FlgE